MISGSLTVTPAIPRQHPTIVVAALDRDARARIVEALAGADATVRGVATPREVLSQEVPDLLVMSCAGLCNADVDLARDLKREHSDLHIVLVCETATGRAARRAIDHGVEGLVLADDIDTTLMATLRAVLVGQTVTPTLLRAGGRRTALSFREKQILGLVGLGYTNGQIGAQLFLAESTVKSHLSSAFTKLEVSSRSEAAALVLDPREGFGIEVMRIAEQLRASSLSATA